MSAFRDKSKFLAQRKKHEQLETIQVFPKTQNSPKILRNLVIFPQETLKTTKVRMENEPTSHFLQLQLEEEKLKAREMSGQSGQIAREMSGQSGQIARELSGQLEREMSGQAPGNSGSVATRLEALENERDQAETAITEQFLLLTSVLQKRQEQLQEKLEKVYQG